jgi:hypothetical protein
MVSERKCEGYTNMVKLHNYRRDKVVLFSQELALRRLLLFHFPPCKTSDNYVIAFITTTASS